MKIKFFVMALAVNLFWGSILFAQEQTQQFQGFNLQGYTDGGNKSWDVQGDTADVLGNMIKLTNIVANSYGDQKVNLTARTGDINKDSGNIHLQEDVVITTEEGAKLTTDSLDWHRNDDLVKTDDFVTIQHEEMVATGTGVEAHPNKKLAQLNQDVTVRLTPDKEKSPQMEKVTVTCDGPLEIDQLNNSAVFNDNVVAIQTGRELKADKMEVFFDPQSKKIQKVVCTGHVEVTQGENKSYSEIAVYSADDQKLILTGRPKLIMSTEGGNDINIFGNLSQ